MTTQHSRGTWALTIPNDFLLFEEDADVVGFQTSKGLGALQLSSYLKDGLVNDEDLAEFSEGYTNETASLREVTLGDFTGFVSDVTEEGWSFRYWFLRCQSTMIFATYTCHHEDKGIEDKSVDLLLGTLTYNPR